MLAEIPASILHLAPDAWTASATWAAVVVALVAVVVGRRQLQEARTLRKEQAQPYVTVFAEDSGSDPRLIDLVIKNFGKTAATDVRVVFSPPPDSALWRENPALAFMVPDVIPVLVPGQEWRTLWDFTPDRQAAKDLSDQYTATVTFNDSKGNPVDAEYRFVIDWRMLINRGFAKVYNMHDAAEALREISMVLRDVKAQHGIKVVTRNGDAIDDRARDYYPDRRGKQVESDMAPKSALIAARLKAMRQKHS